MPSDIPSLTSFFTKVCGVVSTSTNDFLLLSYWTSSSIFLRMIARW